MTVDHTLIALNVALIIANLYVLVLNARLRARIRRQLRAHQFAATEPLSRREGPS